MNNYADITSLLRAVLDENDIKGFTGILINDQVEGINQQSFCEPQEATVKFSDGRKNISLFLKGCKGFRLNALNMTLKLIDKEIYFYSKVVPALLDFEKARCENSELPLFRDLLPRYYGCGKINDDVYLILDKIDSKYVVTPQNQFFHTLEEIELILEHLAVYHATSYCMKTKRKLDLHHTFPELKDLLFNSEKNDIWKQFLTLMYPGIVKLLKTVAEETNKQSNIFTERGFTVKFNPEIIDRLAKLWLHNTAIFHELQKGVAATNVVGHGDFHMYNVAVNSTNRHCVFFDFQLCRVSSVMNDIHQYVMQVSTAAFRKQNSAAYLQRYIDRFHAVCHAYDVEISDCISRESLLKEFNYQYIFGFFYGFLFNIKRFVDSDFFEKIAGLNSNADIKELLLRQQSPLFWEVLRTHMGLLEELEDMQVLLVMEKIAEQVAARPSTQPSSISIF